MAGPNVTEKAVIAQLDDFSRTLYADRAARVRRYERFCHTVSALPILSRELVRQADEGEPYDALARGIAVLHKNLVELADQANRLC